MNPMACRGRVDDALILRRPNNNSRVQDRIESPVGDIGGGNEVPITQGCSCVDLARQSVLQLHRFTR
jgi:hypothetical protein